MKHMPAGTLKRYDAFWKHEPSDRPILSITVEDRKAKQTDTAPVDQHDRLSNLEGRYETLRGYIQNTRFFGDAIPQDWANYGPGCLAAMMGSDYIPTEHTVWFGEGYTFLKDWSRLKDLRLIEDSPMYRMVTGMTQLLADRYDGSYLIGVSDLGGNLDILASLRDTQTLLTDLIDYPDQVLQAVEMIDEAWKICYARLRGVIRACGQHGHGAWLGPWCETTYYPLQCDFSAMISPDDFTRFVMPSLTRIAAFLDHSIYHLDGPGQIAHVDRLLTLPGLDGIQWVPGDGNAAVSDEKWFPLYEKIFKAGKCLVLHGLDSAKSALEVQRQFPYKGLWMSTGFDNAEEAEYLLAKAAEHPCVS